MDTELWTAVDLYIADTLIPADGVLDAALETSDAAGLPQINVTPNLGKFLFLLARIAKASAILEIGTLAGYSTIWLARAAGAKGRVITLESEPRHAEVARTNIERAGLADRVEIHLGPALETLPVLAADKRGPFDLIFIDADKPNIPAYFHWAMKLSHPGSIIMVDNVVREGAVIDAESEDPSVRGVRRLNELIAADKRVTATTIQTVGSKGYDGFTIALVNGAKG
jgi:predicted O-methyltransferase YrrM